jgi:S-sulfo-L-cysteine synthase (3-phospho-L-serine-dependent)
MAERGLVIVAGDTAGTGRLLARAARGFGLRAVLLAADPDRYGAELDCYDEVATVASLDAAAVSGWCRDRAGGRGGLQTAGVAATSEPFLEVAAESARRLGLAHPPPEAVARCRNKADSRAHLSACGCPVPAWALCRSQPDALRAAERIGWPVVVRSLDGSGAAPIRVAADAEELRQVAAAALSPGLTERGLPRVPALLVEAYVDGPALSVELWNGRAVTVVGRHLEQRPPFRETGCDVPAPLSSVDFSWVCHAAEQAVAAVDMRWGPAHVELRLAEVPRVVEITPRLAGGLVPRLVQLATGIDLAEMYVALLAGLPVPRPQPALYRGAAVRYLTFDRPGRVVQVPAPPAAVDPRVVEVACRVRPGAQHHPAGDATDRVGHVLAVAEEPEAAAAAAERECARLGSRWRVVGGPAVRAA